MTFSFGNSSANPFAGTLKIANYNAAAGDKLLFSDNLTVDQLSHIQFVDPTGEAAGTYSAQQSGNEVKMESGSPESLGSSAAAPEPGSLAMLLPGLGLVPFARVLRARRRESAA